MLKAVLYCRVSTQEQAGTGVSLAMQRDRLSAWCVANDYEVAAIFEETLSGGRLDNRPEANAAIALACKVRGILLVYSLSRLTRSVRDTLAIAEKLERAGANLGSLSEKIDTNSAVGRMVFRLLSTLNEFEKDQLAERTTAAMGHLRRQNRIISSRIPLGYDVGLDGRTLIQNDSEQEIIQRIAELRASGRSYASIASMLAADSVPTKMGGEWHASTVKAVLDRLRKVA